MIYDVAIIGCGVIGALTARELSRYKLKVCVLEKDSDVSSGASGANSGIVHAGHDAKEGTLKAKYNLLGNAMMSSVCDDLGVKFKNNGSLVIARDKDDENTLKVLLERGIKNGVTNLEIINKGQLKVLEPNITSLSTSALYSKNGGIVCPYGLCIAAIGNAIDNGVELKYNFEVKAINKEKDNFNISSDNEIVQSHVVINCAGIYADKIANLIGDKSYTISSRKGEYLLLSKESGNFVNSTLFSCPSEKGKGILITPSVDGNLVVGPTSIETDGKEDNSINSDSFEFIINHAKKLVDNPPLNTAITSFCGVRAYSDRHDFIIEQSEKDKNFISVAGIESPGLTASPAIAIEAAKIALSIIGDAKVNQEFNPKRTPEDFFAKLTIDEKNALIKKEPAYGEIICRCEQITLGEILHAFNSNPVPKTVDGIKRRVRAGMGRCQGGFCQPPIAQAIANHYNIKIEEVMKNNRNSYIFTEKTK